MRRERSQRGAAMVMSALLLTAFAGAGMLRTLDSRTKQDLEARTHAAGAVFAQWFRAAHHLAQSEEAHFRQLVALQGGVSVPGARLRNAGLVPDWLPARTDAGQTIALGVIDDGFGVPMAFALATPAGRLSPLHLESFVAGAAANRVGDVAGPGREARATRWQGAIERVLGRPLERGELYATADVGIAHDRRIVYRRAQPGRTAQSRMETALDFGNDAGISDVGALEAQRAELAGALAVGTLRARSGLAVHSARVEEEVRARHLEGRSVAARTVFAASIWNAETIEARRLAVETEFVTPRATATGAVSAPGGFVIDGNLEASAARSPKVMSKGLRAWDEAAGQVAASAGVTAHYSIGERARFEGRVTVTGSCAGC